MTEPGPGSGAAADDPFADDDDRPVRWRDFGPEDLVVLVLFWLLAAAVFVQFFTRYVLNSSIGWTEEIARYLLIGVAFIGSVLAVRKNSHIMVEFFYRYIPRRPARALSVVVDLIRIAFFAWGTWLAWLMFGLTRHQKMVSLDISKGWVYGAVVVGFAGMTLRSLQVARRHWRQGYSNLDAPPGAPID